MQDSYNILVFPAQKQVWRNAYKEKMTVEPLKAKFRPWCQRQLRMLHFQEGSHGKLVAKMVVRQLAKSLKCSEILRDLVNNGYDYNFKLKAKRDDDQARLKRKIERYLRKAIIFEYKLYQKSKMAQKEVILIDDSCDSSTKSHSKLYTQAQNQQTLYLASYSGHLLFGDKIAAIADIQTSNRQGNDEGNVLIEWKARKDGTIPRSSWIQIQDMARLRPSALLDPTLYKSATIMDRINVFLENSTSTGK